MNREDKLYHIYAKNRCIYHSLKESDFTLIWETLNNMTAIYSEIDPHDLQFEVVIPPEKDVITYPC
jgi:hypothetical protein